MSQVTGYIYYEAVHIHKSKYYLEDPWWISLHDTRNFQESFHGSEFLEKIQVLDFIRLY